jgi:hypothetical protein
VALVESGPEYVVGEHETPPEKELPLTAAVTEWLYQPFESGARAGTAVTAGLDASYLNGSLDAFPVLPALSVQLALIVAPIASGPE